MYFRPRFIEIKSIQESFSNDDRSFFTFILEMILGALEHMKNELSRFYYFTSTWLLTFTKNKICIYYYHIYQFCDLPSCLQLPIFCILRTFYFLFCLFYEDLFAIMKIGQFFLRYTRSWSDPAIDIVDGPRKRYTIAVP